MRPASSSNLYDILDPSAQQPQYSHSLAHPSSVSPGFSVNPERGSEQCLVSPNSLQNAFQMGQLLLRATRNQARGSVWAWAQVPQPCFNKLAPVYSTCSFQDHDFPQKTRAIHPSIRGQIFCPQDGHYHLKLELKWKSWVELSRSPSCQGSPCRLKGYGDEPLMSCHLGLQPRWKLEQISQKNK